MASTATEVATICEKDELRSEIADVVAEPESWLEEPNQLLGGQAPQKLMETPDGRDMLHNLVQEIKHGMVT